MIIIKSIEPNYTITTDNIREVTNYTVSFRVSKKTASSGDSITLEGSLTFDAEEVLNLESIQGKVIHNIRNLFNGS